ncbi:ATP-binding protein [Roseofilum casamattae]|uniref:ATP-binding protein n=1 Tax=Roseofilum casamattae BLCC-M143 TaxID=3022442 RepID=A0ABT7BTW7_9CYAN|nr:ATP-binding protein [Roseofilum casamattae]MDJ1182242.1 ATP-binding protein [Roseofilum casamattae BLCC-M143]
MPANDFQILKQIFNACDPFRPLNTDDPFYVDCQAVRGDSNIEEELGQEILFSDEPSYQLYAGHRGAGKSTELLRLKSYLEANGCFVVYFAADEEDIDPEDTQYTDILLACTRHLLEDLKDTANPAPLLKWLTSRWDSLKDLALTEISLEQLSIEAQIALFAKITASIRAVPTLRQEIRQRVNPHTITLIDALNQFISEATRSLSDRYEKLVIIADNLDRIVPVVQEDSRTNLEHIFIDRSEQLRALKCNIVYTVPISMVYSNRAADIRSVYGETQILPMIMVKLPDSDGTIHPPGLTAMKEVIGNRISSIVAAENSGSNIDVTTIFDSAETLEKLCLMSGGHMRELLLLMRGAVKRAKHLPIPLRAVQRSITEARDTYRRTVESDRWKTLAKVSSSKRISNEEFHRDLLFSRCIMEYRYLDAGELNCWYDIHPLIQGIAQFQEALEQEKQNNDS